MFGEGYHNVTNLLSKSDFESCKYECEDKATYCGFLGPKNIKFPYEEDGFKKEVGVYYAICPVGSHCYYGMKLKITIKDDCGY